MKKSIIFQALIIGLAAVFMSACSNDEDDGNSTHIRIGKVDNSTVTYTCTACSETQTETKDFYESIIDAETLQAATAASTEVYFGVFPKTVLPKNSEITVDETVYVEMGGNKYYKGSDGEYYAKVLENGCDVGDFNYTDGSEVGFGSKTYRYFKVEPIKWKVITSTYNGTTSSLLVAENVLTASVPYYKYNSASNTRSLDGLTVYASNYKYSQIRAWLNGLGYYYDTSSIETTNITDYLDKGFLQSAFTSTAQALILTTDVVNDGASTSDYAGTITKSDGTEEGHPTDYTCEPTQDKVFLLSEQEATNPDYGFATCESYDGARVLSATDYAKANYANQAGQSGCGCCWYLRSPCSYDNAKVHSVDWDGSCTTSNDINSIALFLGVVPAITVSLQ